MEDVVKKLEARVVELEQKLGQVTTRPEPTDVSADELKAYHKVRELVAADYGDFCGVNDCFRLCFGHGGHGACLRCIHTCINECVCGPCAGGGGVFTGGLGKQFKNFGG